MRPDTSHRAPSTASQEGFALVGLVVAIFIILLALSVAAPTVARSLRREREVEAVHRANQYVNAIRRYYIKTNTYPGSLEQLDKTNNIRYLRQKYTDPMTGKPDWRLIKIGENKTSVKGFFGQPLAGLNSTGIGGAGTPSSTGGLNGSLPNQSSNPTGTGSGGMSGAGVGSNTLGSTGPVTDSSTAASSPDSSSGASSAGPTSASNSPGSGALGSNSASSFSGGGSPFMGVGLPMAGSAIIVVNEKTTYPEWEFLYDPRVEQLKAKVNLFGGGMSSASSSSLGSLSGSQSNQPGTTTPSPPASTPPQ